MNVSAGVGKQTIIGLASIWILWISALSSVEASSAEVPADWVRVSVDSLFSLAAPAGTTYVPGEGIDSIIGTFNAADFKLESDYGAYSPSLTSLQGEDQYQAREVTIDGKAATIVTALSPQFSAEQPYFIGIHFPELGQTVVGKTRLTIYGVFETPDRFALIEQIYETIRFN